MKFKTLLLLLLAVFFSGSQVLAQSLDVDPGLWEHKIRMSSQTGQMEEAMRQAQQQLEALPPQQRQMMEQMMAAQGIVLGSDETSVRICLTKEDIARDEFYLTDENCTQQVIERSGQVVRVRFACDGNPPAHGEGMVTVVNRKQYTGNAVINTQTEAGQPEIFKVDQQATWIAGDCGNIQPQRR